MPDNKDYIKTADENGSINISDNVVAAIAQIAAGEVEGITGLSTGTSPADIVSGILDRKSRPLRVSVHGDTLALDIYVRVTYGVKIPSCAAALQSAVEQSVESMTGLKVGAVNVHVTGLDFPEAKTE